jgi:hypothetical protein
MNFYTDILPLVVVLAFLFLGSAYGIRKIKVRCSNYLANSFLALGSLVFCFGLLEILAINYLSFLPDPEKRFPPIADFFNERIPFVRMKDSIVYINPPHREGTTFGHKFKTNYLGFREKNFEGKKPPNTFRILVFGDSYTYGAGVSEDHRFTNLLEGFLNKKGGAKRYEVLNFGVAGYNTDQERDLMEAMLRWIECDLVVIGFYSNDMAMTTKNRMKSFHVYDHITNINGEKVGTFSNSVRNFSTLPVGEPLEFRRPTSWLEDLKIFHILANRTNLNMDKMLPTPSRWKFISNEFQEMKGLTRKYGLPPPVVLLIYPGQPSSNDYIHPKGELAQHINVLRFVGDRLSQKGFIVADPLQLFQKHSGMGMTVSEWEGHSNYLGHYLYSLSILKTITSHNLLAK